MSLDKTAPGTSSYSLPDEIQTAWTAGPAQCGLTIGAGTWTQSLDYVAPCDGTLGIGVYKKEGDIRLGLKVVAISSGTHSMIPAEITCSSEDFDTGQHLQLRMMWFTSVGEDALTITCGSVTKLRSPSTDPGYPVPELSSLILFSVGLLALAGYVVYKKKR